MKKLRKILFAIFLSIFIVSTNTYAQDKNSINIFFTHDIHDHVEDFNITENGKNLNIGGYERINEAIKKQLEEDKDSLILDAGDYSMGTLFQTIFSTENPSLRLLGEMGYDATTLGNHEFDFRTKGLADSLLVAKNSGDKLPELLSANIDFENYDNVDEKEVKNLKKAFNEYGVKEYIILDRKGYKIGIFGLMGNDSISNAPMAGVNFKDQIETAKKITNKLKDEEKVDLVICLSHSGTWEDKSKSEDEIMAKEVKDIDLIISGHTHTELLEPITVGKTIIVSSGEYGKKYGKIEITKNDKSWKIKNYDLIKLADKVENKELEEKIQYFKNKVQENYLNHFNLNFNEVLGKTNFSFISEDDLGKEHKEEPLANLITDSYIHAIKNIEGDNYKRIAASIVPYGTIRGSLTKGNITVSDVFNISSLGIGPDKISGYPLIEVYLTGKELKTTAEVDASIQPIMDVAQLYISGMNYSFNPNRLIFNKVDNLYLIDENGNKEEIKDDELYRVVTGLYTAQMLSIVKDQSFGLMSIVPKNKSGEEITDFEKYIIYDKDKKEVKEWYALAEYIKSFEKEDGIPTIPEEYSQPLGRKIVNNDKSFSAIFSNPNQIALGLYAIVLVIILIIIFLVRFILKRRKRKK
ncbi:bifunctional metallophosphatase/5'-nucleotidase [Miniphocaeibacter halophilus]|uniref:Bifunctional metallophosphatase/5'-nucleotidase n=1 Tax=Miniphocaeibacter halophilus TaxID=2931922 RepID=A0AC61MQR3_9FIRM|nr:bifunctional UDP-sugar hydrolase/5'-nucleotidase [Miniphocaeibacter halophilus]QQK07944.1 bifunctional metallophosphatase/5'-nucleotidase [Miniphocaeibacter halophilus]